MASSIIYGAVEMPAFTMPAFTKTVEDVSDKGVNYNVNYLSGLLYLCTLDCPEVLLEIGMYDKAVKTNSYQLNMLAYVYDACILTLVRMHRPDLVLHLLRSRNCKRVHDVKVWITNRSIASELFVDFIENRALFPTLLACMANACLEISHDGNVGWMTCTEITTTIMGVDLDKRCRVALRCLQQLKSKSKIAEIDLLVMDQLNSNDVNEMPNLLYLYLMYIDKKMAVTHMTDYIKSGHMEAINVLIMLTILDRYNVRNVITELLNFMEDRLDIVVCVSIFAIMSKEYAVKNSQVVHSILTYGTGILGGEKVQSILSYGSLDHVTKLQLVYSLFDLIKAPTFLYVGYYMLLLRQNTSSLEVVTKIAQEATDSPGGRMVTSTPADSFPLSTSSLGKAEWTPTK